MKLIGKVHRLRRHQAAVAKASLVFAILIGCANATGTLYAATIAEIAVKIRSLKPQERTSYLLKAPRPKASSSTTVRCRSTSFCRWRGFLTGATGLSHCSIIFRRATGFSAAR